MELRSVYLLKLYGYGYGNGNGNGDGNGNGYGNGYGSGSGDGYGYGSGSGSGYGSGSGDGYGSGSGSGDGDVDGYGYGNGNGYGYGYGNGNGYGNGYGVYLAKLWGEWFEVSGAIENSLCLNIPEHHYDKITKEFVQKVDNLENLRILREKIGLEKYISLFGAKTIHEDIDNQGNKMKLYKYDEKGDKVIMLEVICPSTDRMYHLYPPNQKAKTCLEAKNSTFDNKPLAYRHGDVGLLKVDATGKITVPFSET